MIKNILIFAFIVIFYGCVARVSVDSYSDFKYEKTDSVQVLRLSDELPSNLTPLAEIYVGDLLGTTVQCEYNLQLERLTSKAKDLGADYVQITEELKPDYISYCYGIRAKAYKLLK